MDHSTHNKIVSLIWSIADMMYFRPDTSQLLPQFLGHTIYFGPSATYIQLKTNGSTVGHLRLPDVYALPVLLPSIG